MVRFIRLIAVVIFFASNSLVIYAQPNIKTDWRAEWISYGKTAVKKNSWTIYRKSVEIKTNPGTSVRAYISTDSKYWLYVNDKLVVFEGQLKRGPTPEDTYYDEVDIGNYLRKGKNTIAILVWFWGQDGFCHKNSGRSGLLFEAGTGPVSILSDATWKVAEHTAFGATQAPFPNYRLPEYNIHFDAGKDISGWHNIEFDDSGWPGATIAGKAGSAPWNRLWKRPVPLWKDSGLIPYQNGKNWAKDDSGIVRMKLPKNITVTPYLRIEAPAGLLIDIRTDNYKGGSEYNVRTEYVTKKGVQEFETPGYMNGHEVLYRMPAGVKIIDLGYRETRYNTEYTGYFNSDNEALNILWQKSLNTMNVNLRDAIQDPDRERAQWWGDAVIILGEIFYSADSNGVKAIKKSISNLIEWQKEDNVLFSPIPAGKWDKELPAQMLASVGRYGFYKYFEYTNDTAFVRYMYPHVRDYLSLWQIDKNDLVIHRAGGWDWHDWGDKIDTPLLDNVWYHMALDGAARMADVAGFNEEASAYRLKMKRIHSAFNKQFWTGKFYSSKNYKTVADDRGNGLAVVAGLATGKQWKAMRPMLDTTFNSGPYLEKYVLEAYFVMHDAEAGIRRMLKRYDGMIKSPVTTLWEGWAVGSGTYGGGSYNHGWSGGPLTLMSQYIAGLQPLEPGYQHIQIFPQPAGLQQAKMGAQSVIGWMESAFKQTETAFQINTNIPKGYPLLIGLPQTKKPYSSITINNKVVWPEVRAASSSDAQYKGLHKGYHVFELPSGSVTIEGKY